MKHFTLFKTWLLAVVMLLVGGRGVWAETATLTITRTSFPSGALAYNVTDVWSATTSKGDVISGEGDLYSTANQVYLQSKNTGVSTMYHNTTALPGPITKITLNGYTGSSTRTYTVYMNKTTVITKTADGTNKGTISSGTGTASLTLNASDDWRYFWLDLAGGANYLTSIVIEYEVTASDPYTVSFNAGSGTYTGGNLTETSGGAGVTLPAATGCGEWTFAGWATTAVTETTTAPTLLASGTNYKPSSNTTLYAVYSVSEGGGSTEETLTITKDDFTTKSYADNNGDHVKASSTNEDITYNTNQVYQNSNAMQWQKDNGSLYNITDLGSITKIEVVGSSNYLTVSEGASENPTSGTTITATGTNPYTYTFSGNNGFALLKTGTLSLTTSVKFYYTKSSSITTYNSNPNCSAVSISVSEHEFNFSAYVNQSDEDMFEVTAYNLTDDMNFALTGDDTMFEFELADDFDAVAGGIVYVYYKPTAAGNHSATLTISSTGADDVEIALSGKAIPQLDWANLQWPGSGSITVGGAYVIYGQVYQPGLTTVEGNEADIQVWAGYSTDNTNPNTWTNWITASFDAKQGNNYQYKLDLGAEIDAPGTYYYAFRYKLGDAEYVYGGYNYIENEKNGGFWGDDNVSGVLTINTDTSKDINWGNVQWPTEGSIFLGEDFVVYGQVYKDNVTDQEDINKNVKAWIGFTTDFATIPAEWDEGAWSAATFTEKKGSNYEFMFNLASAITSAGDYFYVYRYQYDGGAYYYGGTKNQEWSQSELNFGELVVAELTAPVADQPTGNLFKNVEANWSKVSGVDGYILSVYQKETVQDEVDHVTNGSFEAWTGTKPDGWFGDKTNIAQKDVVEYTESAQDGSKAVQLINASTKDHKRFTTGVVTVQENTEYTITFWARGKGDIRTAIYDGRSTGSGYSAYNDYVGVDSDEWIEYSQKVTATMNTSVAEFIFSVMNTVATNDHLQIDNVSITATMDVTNILHVSGSPVDVTDADNENVNTQPTDPFIYTFTGLKRTTAYYYSVVAYKGDLQSPASNEISFTSGPLTNLDQTLTSKAIYAHHEKVFVNTTAGTSIEIFNVAGQKVSTTIAHDGLNIIPVNYQGVLLVKVGGEVVKLMCR